MSEWMCVCVPLTSTCGRRLSIDKSARVQLGIATGQILREPFIAIAHKIVYCDERLECDRPILRLGTFDEQIRQLRYGHVRFVRAME
jgi:hypothetical protein